MNALAGFYIALALVVGLHDVASAIRTASVSVNFTAPMRIAPDDKGNRP